MAATTDEILVGCRFYLEADGLTDKMNLGSLWLEF